ncbi:MAG: ATP-binding protein, partial [Thermaerobacter sp.]|nr:ATP-binding protein [Thermaerobacter sp.]
LVSLPDGTTIKVPLMPSSKGPDPEPVVCDRCGQCVDGEWQAVPHLALRIWQWHFCDCMQTAMAYTAELRDRGQLPEQRRQRREQFDHDQAAWWTVFPQWPRSTRAKRQTFATFEPRPGAEATLAKVTAWAHTWPQDGFLLTGPVGTGKTHLVRAVVHAALAAERHVLYTSTPYLLERLRPDARPDGPSMETVLDLHYRADVVVWDDLGTEKPTEWVLDRLYLLVDTCYEAERPMLITTNYRLDALQDRVGDRIVSRLLEMGPVWAVGGDDVRVQIARARLAGAS